MENELLKLAWPVIAAVGAQSLMGVITWARYFQNNHEKFDRSKFVWSLAVAAAVGALFAVFNVQLPSDVFLSVLAMMSAASLANKGAVMASAQMDANK